MLVKNKQNSTTVNLVGFNYIRARGRHVEAGIGLSCILIAECESESGARALEDAISDAWGSNARFFDVSKWCHEHNVILG